MSNATLKLAALQHAREKTRQASSAYYDATEHEPSTIGDAFNAILEAMDTEIANATQKCAQETLERAKAAKAAKAATVYVIREAWDRQGPATVEVVPGHSIRIHGSNWGRSFDETFTVGDSAIYDSYNLCYFGSVTSIGKKVITIVDYEDTINERRFRLPFDKFLRYNDNLEGARERNRNWQD
jgi:hypothetical protein